MTPSKLLLLLMTAAAAASTLGFGHFKFEFKEVANDKDKFESVFQKFSNTFGKDYLHNGEANERKRIFQENLEKMDKEFGKHENFKVGVNKFSDMKWEEFKEKYLMQVDVKKDFEEFQKKTPGSMSEFQGAPGDEAVQYAPPASSRTPGSQVFRKFQKI
jgi:hypothetical protein